MSERDVRHQSSTEEGADAPPGAVEELIRHHEVQRLVLLLQAADSARRENPFDAEHFEAVDVRPEIELRRKDAVPDAVPRQERHSLPAQRAEDIRPRWIAERCGNALLFAVGE